MPVHRRFWIISSDALPYHGQLGFFEQTVGAAERFGIVHERLRAQEIRGRFPAFQPQGDERGYWEKDAGILFAERCVAAQLASAASHGADLRYDTTMQELSGRDGQRSPTVMTNRGSISAQRVVLAMGPWLPGVLPRRQRARFAVQRQVLHWFATDDVGLYAPDHCPGFIWMHGTQGEAFYGFPKADSHRGIKVATEQSSLTTSPDETERAVSSEETAFTYQAPVRGRLKGVMPISVHDATCLYTSTPNGQFVIDRHPVFEHVTIVSSCSGHGFKHSAAIGEAVAAEVLGIARRIDLSSFRTLAS